MIKTYELKKMTEDERRFIIQRSKLDIESVKNKVTAILQDVKTNGDKAIKKYTKRFDGANLDDFRVKKEEIDTACKNFDKILLNKIKQQIKYSKKFHKMQIRKDSNIYLYPRSDSLIL